jgi:hypothetical protein
MKRFADLWSSLLNQFPFWHVMLLGAFVFVGCGCGDDWGIHFHNPDRETPPEVVVHEDGPFEPRHEEFEPRRDIEPRRDEWRPVEPRRIDPQRREEFEPRHEDRPWGSSPAAGGDQQPKQPIEQPQAPSPIQQPAPIQQPSTAQTERIPEPLPEAKSGHGHTGATIFCPYDSDEADRLIRDIRCRQAGWTIGPGEDSHFQVVRRPYGEFSIVYYHEGREIGRVSHYYGRPHELDAILGKNPAYMGAQAGSNVGSGWDAGGMSYQQPRQCVWVGDHWECH